MQSDAEVPTGPQVQAGEFLTADEMAALLRMDVRTVRRHAATLGAIRVGDTYRYPHPKSLTARRAS